MRNTLHIKGLKTVLRCYRLRPDTIALLQYAYDNWNPRGFKTWDKFFFGIAEVLISQNDDINKVKQQLNARTRFTKK